MEVWGDKPESQISPRLILEAIADLIANHNDDPDAHLEEGQSLQSHKASEIIDHLANSIVSDKLEEWIEMSAVGNFERKDFHWITLFESLDGYFKTGTPVASASGVYFETTDVVNNIQAISKTLDAFVFPLSWDKNRRVRTLVLFENDSEQEINIFCGLSNPTDNHIGFKVIDDILYGSVGNGSAETTLELMSIGVDYYSLEVVFTAGVQAEFFVDGVSQGVIDSGLPSGSADSDDLIHVTIKTTTTAQRMLDLYFWDLWQSF